MGSTVAGSGHSKQLGGHFGYVQNKVNPSPTCKKIAHTLRLIFL